MIELADRLALYYGAKFPQGVKSRDVVGMQAIDTEVVLRLSKPNRFSLRVQRKKKPDQIIDQALIPLGLVSTSKPRPSDTEVLASVAKPDPSVQSESAEVYEALEQAFSQGQHDFEHIRTAVRRLCHPPYWLPRDLLAYYLAAFLTNSEAVIEFNGRQQPQTQEILKRLVDTEGKGFVIVVPKLLSLNDDERGYLHAVADRTARSIKTPAYAGSLKVSRTEGVLRRREWEQIRTDLRAWWHEVGAIAKARDEQRPDVLETFAHGLLHILGQGFRDGQFEDPEFLVRTIPAKLASNGMLGTLGTKVVAALGGIELLAKAPRPAPERTPKSHPSEEPSTKEPESPESEEVPKEPAYTQEVPLTLASVRMLLEALEDVRHSIENGTQGPSFRQLVERMSAVILDKEEVSEK